MMQLMTMWRQRFLARPEYLRGLLICIAGVVLLSVEGLLIRLLGLDLWSVIWWRGALVAATVMAGLLVFARGRVRRMFAAVGAPGAVAALAFAASVVCFVAAIRLTGVANTLVLASASPLFAAILSRFVLREAVARRTWAAALVVFIGIAAIFAGSWRGGGLAGDAFALANAFAIAAYFVALRKGRAANPMPVIVAGALLSALIAWPAANPFAVSSDALFLLFLLGVVVVPPATALITLGPKYIPAPDAGLVMLLETLLGPLWVWLVLREMPAAETLAGGAVILLAVAAHSLGGSRAR